MDADMFASPAAAVPPAEDDSDFAPTAASPAAAAAPATSAFVLPEEPLGVELSSQTSFEDSPLRAWERQHAEELTEKSRKESERRQKLLADARAELDEFDAERAKKAEAKERQNREEEAMFREVQGRLFAEGDVWTQASRVADFGKKTGEKDVARIRQVVAALKH